jgi:ABC-type multidrug transport system fused ATPase/permease subunit
LTIQENIGLSQVDEMSNMKSIEYAAKRVGLNDHIAGLNNKYATVLSGASDKFKQL